MTLTTVNPALLDTQAQYTGFKNRIINGAMVIDQRNAGASVTPVNGEYQLDRWTYQSSQASKVTLQQNAGSVTPPAGFSNYLGITSTSAYTVGAGEWFVLIQKLEGFNFYDFGFGTANAQPVTISFRVYSSLTGTFGGSFVNEANTRSYPFSYSVPVANTWTTISITIPGDTTGTWVGATNASAARLYFSLGVGSTYSGTANIWASTQYRSVTGAVSVVGTSGATFYITGVQLEKGSTATSFDYRPYGTELGLCQRYFEKSFDIDQAVANGPNTTSFISQNGVFSYVANNNAGAGGAMKFAVAKRTVPTITGYGTSQGYWGYVTQGSSNSVIYDGGAVGPNRIGTSGFTGSQAVVNNAFVSVFGHWTASAEL